MGKHLRVYREITEGTLVESGVLKKNRFNQVFLSEDVADELLQLLDQEVSPAPSILACEDRCKPAALEHKADDEEGGNGPQFAHFGGN